MARIDQFTSGTPVVTDVLPFGQGTTTRKATVAQFKTLITADVTASLSDKANNTDANRTTTSKDVTGAINELNSNKAPISSPNFTGTPMISSKNIATFETISLPTLLNGWNKIIGDMNNSCVRVGNVITINASIGGGNSADGTVVFNLPLGFRAGTNILQPAYNWANRETAFVMVKNNGDVTVRAGINSTDTFILSFSFLGA